MVERPFSEGAEAVVLKEKFMGVDSVLKKRNPKRYRIKQLDTQLRLRRTRSEARIMLKLLRGGVRVPRLLSAGRYTIRMELIDGTKLSDMQKSGGIPVSALRKSAAELAKMHDLGIAHGDFTPANIFVSGQDVFIIDFGLSSSNAIAEEKAIDILLMKRSIKPEEFQEFLSSYKPSGRSAIISKLAAIERMGRYQSRTMDSKA
ncbi:MAG: Kae1-associated serine/threonine protein kinase [Candidatus Marsarchaeota archaeon]|jgi:Kae1-associated kinase Bud32|nr:Kae1-associated serine/threonine protein kinase [Candidatus Marsarchaeota archaeon]